jgi:hypothetical protein
MTESGEQKGSKVQEIEDKIAELKSRWPKHSVKVAMWQQLEELEEELERAKKEEAGGQKDSPS